MMDSPASQIVRALAENAESVCRHYLSNGRREGRYWLVGDVGNTPGRSLYVRLVDTGDGRGQAGKWTDAQSGDHGDLLDIIAFAGRYASLRETLDEARRFLSLPQPPRSGDGRRPRESKAPTGTPEAARRLWSGGRPISDTPAGHYLATRGITHLGGCAALRFHASCYYRASKDDTEDVRPAWPAMIAAVTDLAGTVTGVHRTWLALDGADKAPVAFPRRAMGSLLGNGVRFGGVGAVMVAGEGIETILSLRQILPTMPMIAGLSAAHLAAILFPPDLTRLYVARDDDRAGAGALVTLIERAGAAGIEIVSLEPRLDDFNSDLRAFGPQQLAAAVRVQLRAGDAAHFLA